MEQVAVEEHGVAWIELSVDERAGALEVADPLGVGARLLPSRVMVDATRLVRAAQNLEQRYMHVEFPSTHHKKRI